MTSIVYSPADSRGWGFGNSAMRDYYLIGGALQPSDVYTVRVREHWRRKSRKRTTGSQTVVAPGNRKRRTRTIAIQVPPRTLRSTRRLVPVTPVVPALPAPPVVPATSAAAVPAVAVQVGPGNKRRRLTA